MRPTTRPPQPYTRAEILDRVYQHFAVDGNPQCRNSLGCVYHLTGCAVGCMMTMEDAKVVGGTVNAFKMHHPEIFSAYFSPNDRDFLRELQIAHDFHFADPDNGILAVLRKHGYPVKPDAKLC